MDIVVDDVGIHLHGSEFGAATDLDYESLPDTFLGGPKSADTHECIRKKDGDVIPSNLDYFNAEYSTSTGRLPLVNHGGFVRRCSSVQDRRFMVDGRARNLEGL